MWRICSLASSSCVKSSVPKPCLLKLAAILPDSPGPCVVALVVTFKPSVDALLAELAAMAAAAGKTVDVQAILIDDAFDALLAGNQAEHDRLIVQAASKIRGYDVIVFGQFSMSSAAAAVQALQNVPVLTTPDCAVRKLKRLLTQ